MESLFHWTKFWFKNIVIEVNKIYASVDFNSDEYQELADSTFITGEAFTRAEEILWENDQEYNQREKELMVALDLEALQIEEEHFEGEQRERYTNYYERDPKLSAKAISLHGTKCMACNFDFEKKYGE